MDYKLLPIDKYQFFSFAGLLFIGLVLLSAVLATVGFFYAGIIYAYITTGLVILTHLFLKNKLFSKVGKQFWAAALISAGFILLFSIYSIPTIFSGRDQGSYSEAAIRLAQNHRLKFSTPASEEFFKIYGPGKALNFPGFSYAGDGKLITQFPVGYVSWLAAFFSIFGLYGFIAANAASFFIFLVSFYLLSKKYLENFSAFLCLFLILASFVFSWFFKFTLSENLALGIVFFGLCQLVFFLKNSQKIHFFSAILSFLVLFFVKTEAIFFMTAGILSVYWIFRKEKRKFPPIGKKAIVFFLLIFLVYLINLFLSDGSYYRTIGKALIHAILGRGAGASGSSNIFRESVYTFHILSAYSLLVFVVLGIAGFLHLIFKRKRLEAIPFLILLPSFFYLLQPSISDDHPWMLRRFVFSIIPICILYSIIFLENFLKGKKYLPVFLSFLLLLSGLPAFIFYLPISENKGLLDQTQKISKNFKDNDLVLVDQMATGDNFSMMTGPMNFLYNKQAVYFINPSDLDKIDKSKFDNIYFIIPNNSLDMYEKSGLMKRFVPVKDYSISTMRLDIQAEKNDGLISSPIELPIEKNVSVTGKIYLLK